MARRPIRISTGTAPTAMPGLWVSGHLVLSQDRLELTVQAQDKQLVIQKKKGTLVEQAWAVVLGCCQNNANWCPLTLTRRASGRTELALVGDSGMQAAMALHGFPEEIQYGVAVTALRHKGFQDFPFLTGGSLNLVGDTVDLHEDLVELPAPGGQRPHSLHAFPPDLGGEHRAKPVPTEANHLMADVDPPLMQQLLDIPERLQAADVEHTARLMISGEALKERKGLRWVIPRGKAADRIASTNLVLTRPLEQLTGLI